MVILVNNLQNSEQSRYLNNFERKKEKKKKSYKPFTEA
jgi:hypothetical protein